MSHRRRRCQTDRIADLPDAGWIAAGRDRRANDVQDGALTLGQTRPGAAAVFAHGAECSLRRTNNQTCVRGVSRSKGWPASAAEICRCLSYRLATVRSHVLLIEHMSEYIRTQERRIAEWKANR